MQKQIAIGAEGFELPERSHAESTKNTPGGFSKAMQAIHKAVGAAMNWFKDKPDAAMIAHNTEMAKVSEQVSANPAARRWLDPGVIDQLNQEPFYTPHARDVGAKAAKKSPVSSSGEDSEDDALAA